MFDPKIKELIQVNQLNEEGKTKEALQIVLELEQENNLSLKQLLSYKLAKANLLRELGNYPEAIEIAEETYKEFQKLGDLVSSLDTLLIQAYSYMIMANITQSENLIPQIEKIFEVIKETLAIDLRERESQFIRIKACIHFFKGEIQQSLQLNKQAYELTKDLGNKVLISASLNNIAHCYNHIERHDKAIMYAKKAIKVNHSLTLAVSLATLIDTYVSKGDIKEAKVHLDYLREHSIKFDCKWDKDWFHHSKALILKSSLRARDRIKSEDIFKELALNSRVAGEVRNDAIINLCDLYLTELQITNDPDLLNEINTCIQELLTIAEKQHSYLYLAETYFLQAKLSLLNLDLNKSKQFLTKAQNIAESYGMKRLAMKISYEHDELLRKTKMWENLKISELSLSERLKLSGLSEQIENMAKKRLAEVPEISKEDPVMLLFLTEGGNLLFSKKFIQDFSFEDDILGGFLTTINYIINEVFSEGLDRAVFGQYTLIMMAIEPFLACYIFKGHSYYAYRKIRNFLDSIKSDNLIWQSLDNFFQKSKPVKFNDIPKLESLIKKTFV